MLLTLGQLATFPLVGLLFFTSQSFSAAVDDGKGIEVFGDSYSDTGNLFRLSQGRSPDPRFSWNGRASNGPIWIDYLSRELGEQVKNYAYGGATTSNVLVRGTVPGVESVIPSVLDQINEAHPQNRPTGGQNEGRGTQVVFAGTNNYLSIIRSGTVDENLIRNTVNSLIAAIEILRSRTNAQKFFIPNLPPLELTPLVLKQSRHVREAFARAVNRHNELLKERLDDYQRKHPRIRIVLFDIHTYLSNIIHRPRAYGFENASNSCVNSETRTKCTNPDLYLFWDDTHLTTRANALLAREIHNNWPRS